MVPKWIRITQAGDGQQQPDRTVLIDTGQIASLEFADDQPIKVRLANGLAYEIPIEQQSKIYDVLDLRLAQPSPIAKEAKSPPTS